MLAKVKLSPIWSRTGLPHRIANPVGSRVVGWVDIKYINYRTYIFSTFGFSAFETKDENARRTDECCFYRKPVGGRSADC